MKFTEEGKLFRAIRSFYSLDDYLSRLALGVLTTYESARFGVSSYRNGSCTARPLRRSMGIFTMDNLPYCLLHFASLKFSALGGIFDGSSSSHFGHLLGTCFQC